MNLEMIVYQCYFIIGRGRGLLSTPFKIILAVLKSVVSVILCPYSLYYW